MGTESASVVGDKPICFVLMPISDVTGYEPGHFGRVYEHLLKPAIIDAGFIPVRADDTNKTDYIVIGIIQKVINSAMVLCDFSARNPNVMYELGIRQAFNLPAALIRDRRTDKVFDIQGLRYTEYDESLRVDSVQKDIAKISKAIKETADQDSNSFNSVVHLAGVQVAAIPDAQQVSPDTQLLLSAIANLERRINSIDDKSNCDFSYFKIVDGKIELSEDESVVDVGSNVYDYQHNLIGEIVDIHPLDEKMFVKSRNGKIIPFYARSVKSKGINSIPF